MPDPCSPCRHWPQLINKAVAVLAIALVAFAAGKTFQWRGSRDTERSARKLADIVVKAHFQAATLLEKRGHFSDAAYYYRRAISLQQSVYPEDHKMLAMLYGKSGNAQRLVGDYAAAEESLRRAFQEADQAFPKHRFPNGNQLVALLQNDLGVLNRARGDYSAAVQQFRDALYMLKKHVGTRDIRVAVFENNLALALQLNGELVESQRYFERALQEFDAAPNRNDPVLGSNAAMVKHNLGGVLQSRGEHVLAMAAYEDALTRLLEIYSVESHPNGHPRIATVSSSLGMLHCDIGNAEMAIHFHRIALGSRKLLSGGRDLDPSVATSVWNLANAHLLNEDVEESANLHDEAFELRRRIFTKENFPNGHPDLADSLRDMSRVQEQLGELKNAAEFLRQACEMLEQLYPSGSHPDLETCREDLDRVESAL